MHPQSLRAVLYREGDWWIAQCLERDVTAVGRTLTDAQAELRHVLSGHFALAQETGREPFAGLEAAPRRFLRMWEQAGTEARPVAAPAFASPGFPEGALQQRLIA